MGIFWDDKKPGITEYELKHEHLMSKLDSVFPLSMSSSKQKRAALHTALTLALDRDVNMSSSQKYGLIQRDEFETIVSGLEKSGIITPNEAQKLRSIAEKPLSD